MAESYSPRQQQWRQALHGILLALGRSAGTGAVLESTLVRILLEELKLPAEVTHDALDYLRRDGLISRDVCHGLLVQEEQYSLMPQGVQVLAGGEHKYIRFSNGFLSGSGNGNGNGNVRSTGGR